MSLQWTTEKRKISELKAYPQNPRQMTKKQAEDLMKSLKKFNLVEIPAINTDGTIIAGHQRITALKSIHGEKETEIDVRVPNRALTAKEAEEYLLRSNKNLGEWDWDLLAHFDPQILLSVGFDELELERKLGIALTEAQEPPEIALGEPKTQRGELYALGRHRLLCGDSTSQEDVAKLMDGHKSRLVFTDPPYMIDYESTAGNSYAYEHYGGNKIFNDNLKPEEAQVFYEQVLQRLYENTTDDAPIYWWYAIKNIAINDAAFKKTGWLPHQQLIWVKEQPIYKPGFEFMRVYEPCLYGWKQGNKRFSAQFLNNLQDVHAIGHDNLKDMVDVWFEKRDKINEYVHPTQKPVKLAERAMKKSSEKGDIVLDLFAGSGSTLLAAEQLERTCYTMELDPKYCDAVIKRWEALTGEKAVKTP